MTAFRRVALFPHRLIAVLSAVLAILAAGCGGVPAAPGPASSIPAPRPMSTAPYQVGAYYFPGWPTLDKWWSTRAPWPRVRLEISGALH